MDIGLVMTPSPAGSAMMAQAAEGMGLASILCTDTQCLTPDVWGQLMLIAAATERIEIGTGVTNPVSRDASVTASAALGLQVASGGRVVLGIGRGDSSMAKIGRRPAPPSELELYLTRLRAYLDGEVVDRDGQPSRIEWLDDCEVPRVPIEVAATGPKVIDLAARHADRVCFAVGADTERLGECIARAQNGAETSGRDPDSLRFGAFVNCVIHSDRAVAREAVRGGLSVFAHFSGFQGMDLDALPEGTRQAARAMRTGYDMDDHGVASGSHAQALDADCIHRFGIAEPLPEAIARFEEIRDAGIDFVRIVPGSRDMPREVVATSIKAIGQAATAVADGA